MKTNTNHKEKLQLNHHKYETEIFEMINPECNLHFNDDAWEFTLVFDDTKPIRRNNEYKNIIDTASNFEITVVLNKDEIALHKGQILIQDEGYDYLRDINLSNIYYSQHFPIEKVKITIIVIRKDYIILNVEGKTNFENSTDFDADIIINEGKFKFNKKQMRGIS